MILFTNPSVRAGYYTRSIFKRSLTGLFTRVAVSISYDDNHYTTGTSILLIDDTQQILILSITSYLCEAGFLAVAMIKEKKLHHVKINVGQEMRVSNI